MRITQGCFSFLPDLTDDQIRAQVQYCLDKGWAVSFEFTEDPHPRNTYWDMWGLPMFDLRDAAGVMKELAECRRVYGDRYIRLCGFDSSHGWESVRISFLVNRPKEEPGFRLDRQESVGRNRSLFDPRLCRRSTRGPTLRLTLLANSAPGVSARALPQGIASMTVEAQNGASATPTIRLRAEFEGARVEEVLGTA